MGVRKVVFISAPSADLGSYRQVAKEAVLTLGAHPIEEKNFPTDYRELHLSRGFHDEIGTVRTMVVPWPAAVWISNFPSICEALVRMLRNPKPSLFSRLALEIPDPLSFT